MRHLIVARRLALLLAVALIPSCGGGGSSPTPATPSSPAATPTPAPTGGTADLVITIEGDRGQMSYSPAGATIKVGQTVAWRNDDTDVHTATQDQGRFNTSTVARGTTSAPITMSTAGTFPYHCSFHPGMVASLTVTP
jgi:plastocyanin